METLEASKEIYKTQSYDQALIDLFNDGVISQEEAFRNATSATDMKLKMSNVSKSSEKSEQERVAEQEDVFELKL